MSPTCDWTYNEIYSVYETECRKSFFFEDNGVKENGFKFCPYCGSSIKVVD